ncbi:MAG: TRAP-type mannitol/chloroaromatic compound transport system substrate-binding protein [Myxococcota bacterium]|jgi:TRAP-type mannitol/chloroaromatic compound transport system substrate-binding protein
MAHESGVFMDRREFLRSALVGGGAAALTGCDGGSSGAGPAVHTGQKVQWRLTSSFPRSLDTLFGAAELFAARVEAMTGGNFKIRTYPAGELVPGLGVLDAVQQGTVQVGQTASYYYTGKNPALAFDACVPFGMTARQKSAWLHHGGGLELLRELFSDFNILNFPGGNTGVQMGGWFKKELTSLADMEGLKMRIPGLGGEVMSRLGVSVQVIAGGEIFPALERGAIDATEWVGPYDDEKLGFHKVAKFYHYPGWWEPGPNLSFYVNKDAHEKLSSEYQAIVEAACREAEVWMTARYDALNPPALKRLLATGVQMKAFPAEIMERAYAESAALLTEYAGKDAGYKKIYDAWSSARKEMFRWFGTAELEYANFAFKR